MENEQANNKRKAADVLTAATPIFFCCAGMVIICGVILFSNRMNENIAIAISGTGGVAIASGGGLAQAMEKEKH